jgi:hypothetical protein
MCVIQNSVDTHPGRTGPIEWQQPELGDLNNAPLELHALSVTRYAWYIPRIRASVVVAVGACLLLLGWLAVRQLTTSRASAGAQRAQISLAPIEVIDVRPRAAPNEEPSPEEPPIDAPPLVESVAQYSHEPTKERVGEDSAVAPKPTRERARSRDRARAASPERPQRIYKKLDF